MHIHAQAATWHFDLVALMHPLGDQEHFVLIALMGWIRHKGIFTRPKIKPLNIQLKLVLSSAIWKGYPHLTTSLHSIGGSALMGAGGGIQEWQRLRDVEGAHYLTIKMWWFYVVAQLSLCVQWLQQNGPQNFCVKMCWLWSCIEK